LSALKRYSEVNVHDATVARIKRTFDDFERVYVSYSGGKDSTVMLHMVMEEAIRRDRKVGILVIDLEAQYTATMEHIAKTLDSYASHTEVFWVCLPIVLRNAVTQYEPRWCCWDPDVKDLWVRQPPDRPDVITDPSFFPFFVPRMEFEEFDVLFGLWYSQGVPTAANIGIRADESLNRFRAVATSDKEMWQGLRWTTKLDDCLYNVYPIYDWKTADIWTYHAKTGKPWNRLYDLMHMAGLTINQMRICQPYGDDQRRGLWLYHLIEPQTWGKVVARVCGANSGALYIEETGNVTGYNKISKPAGHTWESFANLLLASLPDSTRAHYEGKFRVFLSGWKGRGYVDGIPDEAPKILEDKHWAPSWRRICKVLLRNDWWCKGLGLQQPKSKAYGEYLRLRKERLSQLNA
jgi:predicted phosphoadenosine phosphosulfate sulfurtransferase